jgi:hypothetical protein
MPPSAAYLIALYKEFPFQEGRLDDLLRRHRVRIQDGQVVEGDLNTIPAEQWPRSFRVHLAFMVTLAATALLPKGSNRLGFAYNANAPRSGKTLLVQSAICPIYGWTSGRSWPVSGQGKNHSDEAELRKSLDAIALEGTPYIFFDNIRCQVESQALESYMTTPTWSGRFMGRNDKTFTAAACATIALTGNGLKASTDNMERFLFCDLFVEEVEATSRPIENVIEQPWIMENREEIFTAVMGLITHWDAMGRPPPPARVRRGFETFGNIIGGIISAAGFGDLFERRPDNESSGNSADTDMRRLVHLMVEAIGPHLTDPRPRHEFTFDHLVQISFQDGLFTYYLEGKEQFDAPTQTTKLHLTNQSNARFGAALRSYAPEKKGRTWELPHNSRLRLQSNGNGRSKRYIATLELTPRGRLHQLLHYHEIGIATFDQWLLDQGFPVLSGTTEEEQQLLLQGWPATLQELKASMPTS